ncbi:MAG: dihydrolipoyl dehydrogenase family protein [Candidatus Dormibacteraceae bacterium]
MPRTDLIVIGAGSAGLVAARTAAALGGRVTLVEADRIGGDCTWTGCVPSKALIHAAANAAGREGGSATAALARVQQAIEAVHSWETPEALARMGVEVVAGTARFRDPRTLEVGSAVLTAPRFVICTGAVPAAPPIPGLEEVGYLTHRTVFSLDRLPASVIVLGGGAVGIELAQALSRLGSVVTLVEQAARLVPIADPDAGALIAEVLAAEGVQLHLGVEVERVRHRAGAVLVEAGGLALEAQTLLVATGRRAFTHNLGLEASGVKLDRGAIQVDRQLRTSTKGIFAAGDVTGGPQFTHYAGWQGYAAARNALLPGSVAGVRGDVPWTIFTDPAIARVGPTLEDARTRHPGAVAHRIGLDRVDRAQTDGSPPGFLKLVSDGGDKLLGASVLSPHAGELVNELSLAIELGASIGDLARTIHVYPTYGSGLQDLAAEVSLGRAAAGGRGRLLRGLIQRLG